MNEFARQVVFLLCSKRRTSAPGTCGAFNFPSLEKVYFGDLQITFCLSLFALLSFSLPQAQAEESYVAPICSGFDTASREWDYVFDPPHSAERVCPAGSAFMAHRYVAESYFRKVSAIPVSGSCCALPPDALLDEHTWVEDVCPDGYVGTGSKAVVVPPTNYKYFMRCTKVNQAVYSLGAETEGWIVGSGSDQLKDFIVRPWGKKVHRTVRGQLPVSLRYGVLRRQQYVWDDEGCIGHPWGSLLTGRRYGDCSGLAFRQLLKNQSSAASVISECRLVDDPYSSRPLCAD